MAFNENTRVKIPAILHLTRLGYRYIPLKDHVWDTNTNIFGAIFANAISRLNPDLTNDDISRLLSDLAILLDYDDLGQAFYQRLTTPSGIKLIDFKNFANNTFHVVTELTYKNGDDEFRPDITLLINGLPLIFIEVKKPNNRDGVLAERDRINTRFKNKKFKKFVNISQILVFSNNMEYDPNAVEPLQGAFYATTSYGDTHFNYFREEDILNLTHLLAAEDDALENAVLRDNNLSSIKHSPEFITNKQPHTPTNRLLTSLFCKARLAFWLKYGLAYVKGEKSLEKHIMRYPQFFATQAIEQKIAAGIKKGIIWHTQGSGKTALAYYNTHYLTDVFQRNNLIPKFYFIVDRLDLLIQAASEFRARGLNVHSVNSKNELIKHFKSQQGIHNLSGAREITVVNIQKFKEDNDVINPKDYDLNVQRVYFLDEVHRSYNPTGSFLANLFRSDRNAILIGLTGTPLIGDAGSSRAIFGDYIHKYYYNASIADGYTLRLIREGIETKYKLLMEQALKEVEILKGDADKRVVYAHDKFVEPMLDYVVEDFVNSRNRLNDHSIAGMVVCDSAEQASTLFKIFVNKYSPSQHVLEPVAKFNALKEPAPIYQAYTQRHQSLVATLILHDVGSLAERKQEIEDFKAGKIDLLFVYNMLLTGFDAKRLKKLYIGRLVKDHNLLQTLTRVNRPYKSFRYGYVVDFADIRQAFDATNKAYFDELQAELGDERQHYANLFKSKDEIENEIAEISEKLFQFDLNNAEIFSQQISQIEDRSAVLALKKVLENARDLYNLIRLSNHDELLNRLDFKKLTQLLNETSRHLELLNLRESLQNNTDSTNLLNAALENVVFMFRKVSEAEMVIADQLKETLRKTREALGSNFDQADPQFVSLYDELKRMFEKKNLDEISQDEMRQNIQSLQDIHSKINELNRKNTNLKAKYHNDEKYTRVHKRMVERQFSQRESDIYNTLTGIKTQVDERVLMNKAVLNNEDYFNRLMLKMVVENFEKTKVKLTPDSAHFVNGLIVKEYMREYQGVRAW